MPSLTPLHETYCKWDSTPPSQADLLEGLAQLLSTPLNNVVQDFMRTIQREIFSSIFKKDEKEFKSLQNLPQVIKFNNLSMAALEKYGHYFLAPSLRQLVEQYPKLHEKKLTPILHFIVGVVNGLIGDYLMKYHNPIGLPMVLYDHYGEIQRGDLSGRVVIFVHGLCMNHLSWSYRNNGGLGEKLLAQRDHNTMLYLNYNSGRRISANGRSLANTLEDLIQRNPRITSFDIIGHSMGGLVARSALFYGKQDMHRWVYMVENLVCLGSPHHGAALERFNFAIQEKLGRFPIVKLFKHFVNIRSNGILDLRYGSVRDDDWEHNKARIGFFDDNRKPAPLPAHINTYLVAGTLEFEHRKNKTLKVIGDYLVSVKSALGEHPNPRFQLKLPESHKAIFYGLNHAEIQYHSSVAEQIVHWFYPEKIQHHHLHVNEHIIDLHQFDGIAMT